MLFVNKLSSAIKLTLENMHKNQPCHAARTRAHAVLLSNAGYKIKELSGIFVVCRQTTATWLHSWEEGGICALLDNPRSGRPYKLTEEYKNKAKDSLRRRKLRACLSGSYRAKLLGIT